MTGSDTTLEAVVDYVDRFAADDLPDSALDAAKLRVADTIAALLAAHDDGVARLSRGICANDPSGRAATVLGTAVRTRPELAAFANATAARCLEINDAYHKPGTSGGHPSDVITPLLAVAEAADRSGCDFLAAVVLGYELYLRLVDVTPSDSGFDSTTIAAIAIAAGAAWLLRLTGAGTASAVSIATVSNNALNQSRQGELSMWKAVAAGEAGRAGVFAAALAEHGITGPALPFEGTHGWFRHVRALAAPLGPFGGREVAFKVTDGVVKLRPAAAVAIPAIIAAERAGAQLVAGCAIRSVLVETYSRAVTHGATGAQHWSPTTRETADHSIPFVVAAALCFGEVGLDQFGAARLVDPVLREVMSTVTVVENAAFTADYESEQGRFRARVTVEPVRGRPVVGEAGELGEGLTRAPSRAAVGAKFASVVGSRLDPDALARALEHIWRLDEPGPVRDLPALFVGVGPASGRRSASQSPPASDHPALSES